VNGLWDMGGNALEWTDNGALGSGETARPTRGGSWWNGSAQMHRHHAQTKPAETSAVYIGSRRFNFTVWDFFGPSTDLRSAPP